MPNPTPQTDILFISEQPLWPPDQGFRVHGVQMARALAEQGHRVTMASLHPTTGCDAPWLNQMLVDWPEATDEDHHAFMLGWRGPLAKLRRKLAGHQALSTRQLAGLIPLVDRLKPKAVIALGQHGPILLRSLRRHVPGVATIWYAADEPVYFQLSCLRREGISALGKRLYQSAVYAGIHTAFAHGLDGAIGVSPIDAKLLKLLARTKRTINLPNGVDTTAFAPSGHAPKRNTLIFWGRLDFEPNIDAVCWFARKVWPRLRERQPQARWKIVGKSAADRVVSLGRLPGIEFVGEVEAIGPHAQAAAATLLPMRCGGGIKNKLLEAAAMGLPILASAKAVKGLTWPSHVTPVMLCKDPDDWVHQIERVWFDGILNQQLREDAREWVTDRHTWPAAASALTDWLQTMTTLESPDLTFPGSIAPKRAA